MGLIATVTMASLSFLLLEDFALEDEDFALELDEVLSFWTLEELVESTELLDFAEELLGFAELDDAWALLEAGFADELLTAELLAMLLEDFAELDDVLMLDEDCATELLDFTEELLGVAELEDTWTLLDVGFADELLTVELLAMLLDEFAELLATLLEDEETFDEDEISSLDATTLILPVTVFVFS